MPWNVVQRHLDGHINCSLLDLNKLVALQFGMVLTELRITRLEDGWRAMIKGTINDKPYVVYTYTDFFDDALEFSVYEVVSATGTLKHDSYPVRV